MTADLLPWDRWYQVVDAEGEEARLCVTLADEGIVADLWKFDGQDQVLSASAYIMATDLAVNWCH